MSVIAQVPSTVPVLSPITVKGVFRANAVSSSAFVKAAVMGNRLKSMSFPSGAMEEMNIELAAPSAAVVKVTENAVKEAPEAYLISSVKQMV